MEEKFEKDLEKMFNPEVIQQNLLNSSLYLTAFELLKGVVEQRLKDFMSMREPFDENYELRESAEYKRLIRNKKHPELGNNKNIYYSSCLWLKENEVITKEDFDKLQEIRLHRNKIAHQLPRLILDSEHEIDLELYNLINELITKIERWWIAEVEIPSNPDFDNVDVDINKIKGGNMLILEHIIAMTK